MGEIVSEINSSNSLASTFHGTHAKALPIRNIYCFRTDEKDMWKEGYYVKELINSYLSSVKKAEEEDQSEIPKWPSWEMNNHEQVVEGK